MSEIRSQCEGCGQCCRAIFLPISHEELTMRAANNPPKYTGNHAADGDLAFVMANFLPITGEEALIRNPHLKTWVPEMNGFKMDEIIHTNFYSCVNLNEDTGRCMTHDNLSRVCSEYPWYGSKPTERHQFYADDCFYKNDLVDLEV